jgi:hypothetical protein
MTSDQFRDLALSFKDSEERSHMGHPDFRVNGRIFATLSPDGDLGMVRLTASQQSEYMHTVPRAIRAASGSWGEAGATMIQLEHIDESVAIELLHLAWQNTSRG